MAKLVLITAATLLIVTAPLHAKAQGADHTDGSDRQSVQARPDSDPSAPKRGISEEGGMKASGPSQAKGGESR